MKPTQAPMPMKRMNSRTPYWLREIKFDGYRTGARLEAGRLRMLTRNGLDWALAPRTQPEHDRLFQELRTHIAVQVQVLNVGPRAGSTNGRDLGAGVQLDDNSGLRGGLFTQIYCVARYRHLLVSNEQST